MAARVCRVVPDVVAIDRAFDYAVPDDLAQLVRVGTIVRVSLHGRRVRGWVVAEGVESFAPPETLLPVIAAVSEGPPDEVIDLTAWAAHRYAGSRVALLRSASPPNNVAAGGAAAAARPRPTATPAGGPAPTGGPDATADSAADAATRAARAGERSLIRWPPLLDRRRLVAGLMAEDGSTIVTIADGAKAGALVRWLVGIGRDAVLLRGDDSAAVRTAAWRRARSGGVVVAGGRLAALAPVPDLRAAIVVDDADEALKEERVPAWHARDLLDERARRAGARYVILSAAPTLDSIASVGEPVTIPRAVEAAGWPRVDVVDRRADPPGSGLFSEHLAAAIRHCLAQGQITVCVLNRRGRARLLACGECGKLVRRDRSGAPLWSTAADAVSSDRAPDGREPAAESRAGTGGESSGRVCPHCGAIALRTLRSGVTRVREELAALLPRTEVGEVDASTVEVPAAPVLVGTEAVLHRSEVRRRRPAVVAYLDFDQELLAPRFRAAEQAMWLLVRGAHLLAGRPRSETRLLVQTRLPEHSVLQAAVRADPGLLAGAERSVRQMVDLPPVVAMAELSGDEAAVESAVARLREVPGGAGAVSVVGPTVFGGAVRALVKAPDAGSLADALESALPAARALGRLRCEVDPLRA